MEFKDRFSELLKYCGKSQVEIANAVGVSKQCITDYKSGRITPSIDTLYQICKFLDVSSDYLLGLSNKY